MQESTDLFFEGLVRSYVEENPRFLRRDWLAKQLDEKLRESGKPFVLLTAEPGAGKSAFMTQLAHDHPDWLRYFIRRDQSRVLADVSARSLLLSIGYQIAAQRPELFAREQLTLSVKMRLREVDKGGEAVGVEIDKLIKSPFYRKLGIDVDQQADQIRGKLVAMRINELYVEERLLQDEDLLHLALIDPARTLMRLNQKEQIVILIDALDEISYQKKPGDILAWLTKCPELPENIRFVLTSRPPDEALNLFCNGQVSRLSQLAIGEHDPEVQVDIEQFVNKWIDEAGVAQAINQAGGTPETFAMKAMAKAHGNLGYVDALARGIDRAIADIGGMDEKTRERGRRTLEALLSLKELPNDQSGLYAFFLIQIKDSVARERIEQKDLETGETYDKAVWPTVYHKILGVLAVALEPLDLGLIEKLGGIQADRVWVSGAIDRLTQFLDVMNGRYRFYHATLAEFLTDTKTRDNSKTRDLYQDAGRLNGDIPGRIRGTAQSWPLVDWSAVSDYGLVHLLSHLLSKAEDGPQRRSAYDLICKPFMREKYRRFGSHASFAQDVERLFDIAERHDDLIEMVRLLVCRGNLTDIGRDIPESLITALVLLDDRARAEACIALIKDPHRRISAYLAIAHGELERGHLDDAMTANRQALDIANNHDVREQSMIEVGNALLDVGATTDALQIARRLSTKIEAIRSIELREAAVPKAAVLLGRSGAPAEALALLSKLHSDARDSALSELAMALARAEDCCFALVAVQEIFSEERREAALKAVAEIVGSDASRLVAAADRIESAQERSQALSALASVLAPMDSTEARSLAQSALDLACSLGNDHRAAEAISKAVEPIAILGGHECALEIARRIGYQLHRNRALTAVVRALVGRRDFDLAEAIAAEISEDDRDRAVRDLLVALLADRKWGRALAVTSLVERYRRHVTLTWLSYAFLDAGETEHAIQAATLASQSAAENGLHGDMTAALCAEARAYMRAGDVESALGAAGRVSVQQDLNAPLLERIGACLTMAHDRLRVLTEIAWADADAGRPEAAIRLLIRSESPPEIADAFRAIAERLFERGRVAEAVDFAERSLRLAPKLEDATLPARIAKWMVELLKRAGHWERATEVARTAGDDYAADVVLKHRVSHKIADGRYDEALQLVAEMKLESLRHETQADVARGLAETGSWERAIHIASELHGDRDPYAYIERSAALSDITLKLARAGLADQALTLATDLLIVPQKRQRYFTAVSLVEIAEALASAGQTVRCVELLERALGVAKASSPGHNLAYQLMRVAVAFAIAGQTQRTVEVIEGLSNAGDRMKALSDAAERLEEARMYEVSLKLSEHSLEIAEQVNDAFNRAVAQSHVATALAWLGDIDGALGLIARIENSHKQRLAIKAAAQPIVEAGRVDDLKDVIGRIDDETFNRREALRAFAVALAEAGHPNRAQTSADVEIGVAESAAGKRRVERLEHEAVLAYGNDRQREKVAIGFARVKCFERALDMFCAIEGWTNGTEGTDGALAQMAPYFAGAARTGDLLSALERRLSSPRTLRAFIGALVATGYIDAGLQGWRFVLERSVGRDSDDIFDLVAAGASALARIDGGATLLKMCDAMFEVDAWWER